MSDLEIELASAKAEIESWQGGYMTQKQEIANLDTELKAMRGAANSYKAEIERLKNIGDNKTKAILRHNACIEELHEKLKTAKAEAYKEFAERSEKEVFAKQDDERKQMLGILKTYRGTKTYSDIEQATDNWLRGYGEAVQNILSINDNLLKELVGGDK